MSAATRTKSIRLFVLQSCILIGLMVPLAGCGGGKKDKPTTKAPTKPPTGKQPKIAEATSDYDYLLTPFRPTLSANKTQAKGQFAKTKWLQKDLNQLRGKLIQPSIEKMIGRLPPEKKQKTIEFVQTLMRGLNENWHTFDEPDRDALYQLAKEIIPTNYKSADPFLNYCISLAHIKYDKPAAQRHLDAAIKGYVKTDYPCYTVLQAHDLRSLYSYSDRLRNNHAKEYAETILYCLKYDLQLQPDEYRMLIKYIKTMVSLHVRNSARDLPELVDVVQREKEIPEYFRQLILGLAHNRLAWNARGGGYADTVSQDGWKNFERFQRKAIVHLKNAHRMNPGFPEPAVEMMDIARAGNVNESVQHWFEQATAAQFDYIPAYNSMVFTLYPRWHGSIPKMIAFGEKCMATGRYDTKVPSVYLTTLAEALNLASAQGPTADVKLISKPKVYNKIKECCEKYLEHPSTPEKGAISKQNLQAMLAGYATQSSNFKDAKHYFDLLGDKIDKMAFGSTRCRQTPAMARAGVEFFLNCKDKKEHAEFLKKMVPFAKTGDPKDIEALKEYLSKATKSATSEHQRLHLSVFSKAIERSEQYASGEWVTDLFDPHMIYWHSHMFPYVKCESKNSIVVDMSQNSGFTFSLQFAVPGPKIIEYEIELVDNRPLKDRYDDPSKFVPGIGLAGNNGDTAFYLAHDLFRQRLNFIGADLPYRQVYTRLNAPSTKVQLRIDKNYVEVVTNGKMVLRTRHIPTADSSALTLTTPPQKNAAGSVQYKNLRIKKWKLGAPPIAQGDDSFDSSAMVAYYEKATQAEPENSGLWELLGVAYHANGDDDKAKKAFNKSISLGQSQRFIGYYLGDIAERAGDIATAKKHYRESAKFGHFYEIDPLGIAKSSWLNPQRLATFRYGWLYSIDPANAGKTEEQIRSDFKGLSPNTPSFEEDWVRHIGRAANSALHGKFDQAIQALDHCIKANPPKSVRAMVDQQLAAYQQKKLYQPEKPPMWYQEIKFPKFYMRFWDQIVPDDLPFKREK